MIKSQISIGQIQNVQEGTMKQCFVHIQEWYFIHRTATLKSPVLLILHFPLFFLWNSLLVSSTDSSFSSNSFLHHSLTHMFLSLFSSPLLPFSSPLFSPSSHLISSLPLLILSYLISPSSHRFSPSSHLIFFPSNLSLFSSLHFSSYLLPISSHHLLISTPRLLFSSILFSTPYSK